MYFDEKEKKLFLVQTKWHEDGNGTISQGDALKFIAGVKKVVDLDLTEFNDKIKNRISDIESAVYDANAKIVLVVAHTGVDDLNKAVLSELTSYVENQNDTSEIMSLEVLNQPVLHRTVSAGLGGNPIDVHIQLLNWGQLREPRKAVYGRVFAGDVASWYESSGSKLFEKNIRQLLPASSVNHVLVQTLVKNPSDFWYFNNGITAIASSVEKKPLGGNQTDTGIWECKGFSVVNGAQTVGSIHAAFNENPDEVSKATVSVRIIEIVDEDDAFGLDVTKNTNTQNSVEKRDFVALDPEQDRIRKELKFDGIDYAYKSGSNKVDLEKSFDLTEATIALACGQNDVAIAVHAKREISRLWDDIHKPPYRSLFNGAINGPQLWNLVKILRDVDRELISKVSELDGRQRLIGIHGNRFIQWVVFRKLKVGKNAQYAEVAGKIAPMVEESLQEVTAEVMASFADSYPASLFKNQAKCKAIAGAMQL